MSKVNAQICISAYHFPIKGIRTFKIMVDFMASKEKLSYVWKVLLCQKSGNANLNGQLMAKSETF